MGPGLYIHIPFCHSKCSYCDFYSMPLKHGMEDDYIDALLKEWELRHSELRNPPVTVYLGGGTPSILSDANLSKLLHGIGMNEMADLSEATIEVNPEDVTPARASMWRGLGINRVSMGIQALDDRLLAAIGRRHDSHTAIKAYDTLREAGFGNISLDLMYGLPSQTLEQWHRTLDVMLHRLHPEHLSAYMLSYEHGTRMTAMRDAGKIKPVDDDTVLSMYAMLCDMSRDAGYSHYEISNFALPGCESRHNSSYWDMSPYVGLGPGAHSFDGISIRRSNPWNIKTYIAALSKGITDYEEEQEDAATLHNDLVMVSLRTDRGLALECWPEYAERWMRISQPLIDSGDMALTGGRLAIAERSWPMSDAFISDLLIVM